MLEEKRSLKVFLCHAHADRDAVRILYSRLKREGVDAWLDKEKLLPGADWEIEIRRAVREADVVVVCLSKQFNQAGFRQKEVRIALDTAMQQPEGEIFIIPARLEECENLESLSKWHWVDLFEVNGYQNLIRALRVRADRIGATLRQRRGGQSTLADPRSSKPKKPTEPRINGLNISESVSDSKPSELDEGKSNVSQSTGPDKTQNSNSIIKVSDARNEESSSGDRSKSDANIKDHSEGNQSEKLKELPSQAKESEKQTPRSKNPSRKPQEIQSQNFENPKSETEKAKSSGAKLTRKLNATIMVALIGFVGALAAGMLSSPLIERWLSPVPTITEMASGIPIITSTAQVVLPVSTVEPSQTPTKEVTVVISPTLDTGSIMALEKDGMKLLYVSEGNFVMGGDIHIDEEPIHEVDLDAFWIDRTEVTNAMYSLCVAAGDCEKPGSTFFYDRSSYLNHPVVYVSWTDANNYCSWANRRLPTEAEWEKAARGTDSRRFPWGEEVCESCANYNKELKPGELVGTTAVGNYETGKSPYGAYDMAGNVSEWVSSLYRLYPYDVADGREDLSGAGARVYRGGSWQTLDKIVWTHTGSCPDCGTFPVLAAGEGIRALERYRDAPTIYNDSIGFRCAKDANP